jgi:acyl-CoA synthetase (AMP-forming)/AMP-acid ligase II
MTTDYIAFHAAERASAVAVVENGREITYAQLARDIRLGAGALLALAIGRGSRVGLRLDLSYRQWVLLLALDRLGATAVLLNAREDGDLFPWLNGLDLIISDGERPSGLTCARHVSLGDLQREGRTDPGDASLPPKGADDDLLLLRTSGTTGISKWLMCSRRIQDARVDNWIWRLGLTRASRYLVATYFSVHACYTLALAVCRAGGTVVLETRTRVPPLRSITHVMLLPLWLKEILDTLPPDYSKPQSLMIVSLGARLPEALRERAKALLSATVEDNYGAREVGFVARTLESGEAAISPLAEVEAIDDRGARLPWGESGELRIRTPYMHSDYFGDPDATSRAFRDGWFHTGDIGVVLGPRRLRILGRRDELMNLGGIKLAPETIEHDVLRLIGRGDAGACSIQNAEGVDEIWVAIAVASERAPLLLEELKVKLASLGSGELHLVSLPEIPRNTAGKIQRDHLREAIIEAAALRTRPSQ